MRQSLKLWIKTSLFSLAIYALIVLYLSIQTSSPFIFILEKALAETGLTLINLSFILSSTSYFFHKGIHLLGYRKMIGVIGFLASLTHATLSSKLFYNSFFLFIPIQQYPKLFIPGFLAILIMLMMVIVSNGGIPAKIGTKIWRRLLRVGYIAIIFIMLHQFQLSYSSWKMWFSNNFLSLPPISLLTFAFSFLTIAMRVALFIAIRK